MVVNNCVFYGCGSALIAAVLGDIVENYNCYSSVATSRTRVNTGAQSNSYFALFDTRTLFEMLSGGKLLTPFDLASYSALVNLAGTNPTSTDMRGTAKIGAEREWGALEYDPDLDIEAGSGGGAVSIQPTIGRLQL